MAINRRRAASSQISSDKKLQGHLNEDFYASLIGAKTIKGHGKSDVEDSAGHFHSVKSGKKWQIFLYSMDRIERSKFLKILTPCLEAFTPNYENYLQDRTKCIAYKEAHVKHNGRQQTKLLSNNQLESELSPNEYIAAKERLAAATRNVCQSLYEKEFLKNFLDEAIFNINEVQYLAIRDDTYLQDKIFKVFARDDVLKILSSRLFPAVSRAGYVPEDYNVDGQKTLLKYSKEGGKEKNIVELEVRNDSAAHYRQLRFNMYSHDALSILIDTLGPTPQRKIKNQIWFYGKAAD